MLRTEFASVVTGLDGVAREVGQAREKVLGAVAEEGEAARNERRRAHQRREALDADLAELKETGNALRGWLAERGPAGQEKPEGLGSEGLGIGTTHSHVTGPPATGLPSADQDEASAAVVGVGGTGIDGTGVDGTGVDGTGADGTGVDGTGIVAEDSGEDEEKVGEHVERDSAGTRADGGVTGEESTAGTSGRTGAASTREHPSVEGWRQARETAENLVLRSRPASASTRAGAGDHDRDGDGDRSAGTRETPERSVGEKDHDRVPQHGALLLRAATVSSARLVCHPDAWEFIAARAGSQGHYRPPFVDRVAERGEAKQAGAFAGAEDGDADTNGAETEGDVKADVAEHREPLVRVTLSGRSLIAVLVALWEARHEEAPGMGADWAMAVMTYERIRAELARAQPEGGDFVLIRLDDKAARLPAEAAA